ncbi:hypothetical protein BC943DRAFT_292248 [Umbelopsis sp. AD052]|nr:hypothetical protein BC943DRAFT_292248 [Umbelopsis sp. AD052]
MAPSHLLSKAALALAAMVYVDSKYYISKDISEIVTGLKMKNVVLKNWEDMLRNETHCSIYSVLEKVIQANRDAEGFVYCDRSSGQLVLRRWTYGKMEEEIARLADWYTSMGIKAKDVVAVYLPNTPQIFFTFWALAKLNAVGALINSNQTGVPLTHSIGISKANLVVAHGTNYEPIRDIEHELPHTNIAILSYDEVVPEKCPYPVYDMKDFRRTGKSDEIRRTLKVDTGDSLCYIYTSGTTGLPKAVAIPHRTGILPMYSHKLSGQLYPDDKWYCCLPLYHSSGLLIAMCGVLSVGGTFILSTKFSATNCMEDISKSRATGMSYIGEIARYLNSSPPTPYDRDHVLRFAYGNGLNRSIWNKFRERFNIPVIIEFYGSTEGNTFLRNVNTGPDGVGYFSHRGPLLRKLNPTMKIVKQDPETLEPYRDPKTGFCVEADFDEPGEILGEQVPIISQSRAYVDNKKANDKVAMHDVFKKGDLWHRQGDLIKMTRDGWIEFVDRVGDTFRWRGENVSTMEVASVMTLHPGIDDITVYGITLPKYEGQVGMATIVASNPDEVARDLRPFLVKKGLPLYAHPRFVRVIDVIPVTQTHKHQKAELKKDGIDVYKSVPVYMLTDDGKYLRMNDEHYRAVQAGLAKF